MSHMFLGALISLLAHVGINTAYLESFRDVHVQTETLAVQQESVQKDTDLPGVEMYADANSQVNTQDGERGNYRSSDDVDDDREYGEHSRGRGGRGYEREDSDDEYESEGGGESNLATTSAKVSVPVVSGTSVNTVAQVQTTGIQPTVTHAQLAQHNTSHDCWVVFQGSVYDVTSFLPNHPGGTDAISQFCGKQSGFEQAFIAQHGQSKVSLMMRATVKKGQLVQ